jgi:alpha-tubulin suppressor-like RCC1 family protein
MRRTLFLLGALILVLARTVPGQEAPFTSHPTTVSGLEKVQSIAAAHFHACAVLIDHTVKCWGYGSPLGSAVPVRGLTDVTAVAAGAGSDCALLANGLVRCWGNNDLGQLGNGTHAKSSTPVQVVGVTGAKALVVGKADFYCAIVAEGAARCWGLNRDGQLGNGEHKDSNTPVEVKGLRGATTLAAGQHHACAVLSDETVKCWGRNEFGQLGSGTTTASDSPVTVADLSQVKAIAAGLDHTCAVLLDGTARCWGQNVYGTLGNGKRGPANNSGTPVTVMGLGRGVAIAGGENHTCALLSDGTAQCWGDNNFGDLGVDPAARGHEPLATATEVSGLSGIAALAASGSYSCALLADQTVRCWGTNQYGQLGTARPVPERPTGSEQPSAQMAVLYLLNNSGRTLLPHSQEMTDNGKTVASLPYQTYVRLLIEPGTHVVRPKPFMWNQQVNLQAEPGATYYVMVVNGGIPPVMLQQLSSGAAESLINHMQSR